MVYVKQHLRESKKEESANALFDSLINGLESDYESTELSGEPDGYDEMREAHRQAKDFQKRSDKIDKIKQYLSKDRLTRFDVLEDYEGYRYL